MPITTDKSLIIERLISVAEAAKRYRVSKGFLYERTSAKTIPFYKMSGRVFFDPVELDEIMLTTGRVEPIGA